MTIRCDPVPSGATPASLARARRPYNPSLTREPGVAANSTYLLPKLFPTGKPWSTWNCLVALTSATPSSSATSSTFRVAGPVSFFDDVATYQIAPSGACNEPP